MYVLPKSKLNPLVIACAIGLTTISGLSFAADSLTSALVSGKAKVDVRLRYEGVSQDNALDDANAITIRTRLGYQTAKYNGFSLYAEMENISALDDSYNLPADNPKTRSVVADPELTEFNQAFISYAGEQFSVKAGRQRVILDNARFVGNVGWRQNEQTYDGLTVAYNPNKDLGLVYGYVDRVNTILGGNVDTESHILHVTYNGFEFGKLTAYGYFLDLKSAASNQTLGLRFDGKNAISDQMSVLYTAEFASQSDYADGSSGIDGTYTLLEGGVKAKKITAKVGYEVLGADDFSGFETPLATKHAFNGWADQFLGTPKDGLVDFYLKGITKLNGIKLMAVYHDFSSDKGSTDYGTELDLLAAKKFTKQFSAGIKYADYNADQLSVDTSKLWIWGQFKF